jgi:hypothetical protein
VAALLALGALEGQLEPLLDRRWRERGKLDGRHRLASGGQRLEDGSEGGAERALAPEGEGDGREPPGLASLRPPRRGDVPDESGEDLGRERVDEMGLVDDDEDRGCPMRRLEEIKDAAEERPSVPRRRLRREDLPAETAPPRSRARARIVAHEALEDRPDGREGRPLAVAPDFDRPEAAEPGLEDEAPEEGALSDARLAGDGDHGLPRPGIEPTEGPRQLVPASEEELGEPRGRAMAARDPGQVLDEEPRAPVAAARVVIEEPEDAALEVQRDRGVQVADRGREAASAARGRVLPREEAMEDRSEVAEVSGESSPVGGVGLGRRLGRRERRIAEDSTGLARPGRSRAAGDDDVRGLQASVDVPRAVEDREGLGGRGHPGERFRGQEAPRRLEDVRALDVRAEEEGLRAGLVPGDADRTGERGMREGGEVRDVGAQAVPETGGRARRERPRHPARAAPAARHGEERALTQPLGHLEARDPRDVAHGLRPDPFCGPTAISRDRE